MLTRVATTAVVCALVAPVALADSVTLEPMKDNTMYSESGSLSNGSGQHIFAGETAVGDLRRALLAFDIAGNIPAGSTITSVTLTLNLSRTIAGDQEVALHRVTQDWGEGPSDASGQEGQGAPAQPGDATWSHRFFNTDMWTNQGGDFVATPSATQTVGFNAVNTWGSTPEMVADVQQWLDDPGSSYGWIVIGNEQAIITAKRFDSRDHPTPSRRPQLVVEFTPGSGTRTICPGDEDNFVKMFGGPVEGDALDLCEADDERLEVRQSAPVTPLLPFIRLEYWANDTLGEGTISQLDFDIECHVTAFVAGGQNPDTLRTFARNFATGAFVSQDQRATPSNTDVLIEFTIDENAQDFVRAGDGEVRIRQDVFNPGAVAFPLWFLKVDLYEVTVTP